MTVEQWMEKNFKHDKPDKVRYNGEYRRHHEHWQVYDRWLDCDKDVDRLWLDYEQECMSDLLRKLPKEFLTREFVLQICEDIIGHFGIQKVKTEYWWVESGITGNNGRNLCLYNSYPGWCQCITSLNYDTGIRDKWGIFIRPNPELWNIVWKHIPQISTVIETYGE